MRKTQYFKRKINMQCKKCDEKFNKTIIVETTTNQRGQVISVQIRKYNPRDEEDGKVQFSGKSDYGPKPLPHHFKQNHWKK